MTWVTSLAFFASASLTRANPAARSRAPLSACMGMIGMRDERDEVCKDIKLGDSHLG